MDLASFVFFWEEGWGSGGKAELSDALIDQILMVNYDFVRQNIVLKLLS